MEYTLTSCNPNDYFLYLRKSRADNECETVEETLSKHEMQLQDFAIRLLGNRIPEHNIFREVVSGETIQDRPDIQKILSLIESPSVCGVFVIDPQRLSRGDWEDGGKILSSFRYSRTLILTPPKIYDLNNKFDYDFFKMELSRGNDYLEYTKEILRRGRVASVKNGNFIGSVAPYGFDKITIDKTPTLVANKKEAEAVNIAAKKCVYDDMGWTAIGKSLELMGYKPRSAEHWNPYTLRDICINPVNIGKIRWNRRKVVKMYDDGKLVKKRPLNHGEDSMLVDGNFDGIMDLELYYKLIKKVGIMTKEKSNTSLINPFAGLLYCKCGHAMIYRSYHKNGVERSAARLICTHRSHCNTKSVLFDVAYESIIDCLEDTVKDFAFKLQHDNSMDTYALQTKMLAEQREELKKLDTKQEELYDFLEDGIYTKEVFLQRSDRLKSKREEVEKQIKYLQDNTVEPVDYTEKIATFKDVINALRDDSISAKHKNSLLKTIIKRIDYDRTEVTEQDGKAYICTYRKRGDLSAAPVDTTTLLAANATRSDAWHYFQFHIGKEYKILKIVRDYQHRTVYDASKPVFKVHLNDF